MRKLSTIFIVFLLLLSNFPVSAQTSPPSSTPPPISQPQASNGLPGEAGEIIASRTRQGVPNGQPPIVNQEQNASVFPTISSEESSRILGEQEQSLPFPGAMCVQPSNGNGLSEQESSNILNLLKDGFVGEKISGNAFPQKTPDSKEDRKQLESNQLLLENPNDSSKVADVEIPPEQIEPFEVTQYFNTYIKGPFAFGLVLDDTIRTGRCKTPDANCFLVGKNVKYRNSDEGLLASVKPIKDIGSKLSQFFSGTPESELQLTKEEQDALKEQASLASALYTDDPQNEAQVTTLQRLEKDMIANTVKTDDFEAKMGTNCNEGDCVISTYSLFDKYFNQWMSAEMVASTFGPSLLSKSKKLFGWVGRRASFIKEPVDEFLDRFRVAFESPGSLLGNVKLERMWQRVDRNGWRDWWQSMTIGNSDGTGFPLVKTQEFLDWWGKQEEFLHKLNTVEKRAEFVRVLKDLRTYSRIQHAELEKARHAYDHVVKALGNEGVANIAEHPEARKALIDYGRQLGKFIGNYDDHIGLDMPDWFVRNSNIGLYDKGVKNVNSGDIRDLFSDHRLTRVIIDKFVDTGSWKNFENEFHLYNGAFETDGKGNLILYAFDPSTAKEFGHIDYGAIKDAAKNRNDLFARTDHGDFMRYTPTSVPFIQQRVSGNVELFQGNWAPKEAMTPEEFIYRLNNPRQGGNYLKIRGNVQMMIDTLEEKNFVSRRYWNALDKIMAEEDELIRAYFTLRGGIKWTAYPFGYWWLKKGLNSEDFSFYQLPDTWHYVFMRPGTEKEIYDYSYLDFFANSGSDNGDLFLKVLNKLPWKQVLDAGAEAEIFEPAKNLFDKASGKGTRSEVENLAVFLTGPQECDNCSVTVTSNANFDYFRPNFAAKNQTLSMYLLEDTKSEKARDIGTTLIAFASRLNLIGRTKDIQGEEIDLAKAKENDSDVDPDKEPKSCLKAVDTLPVYGSLKKVLPFLPEGTGVGGALAGIESLTYVTFFWPGFFSSVAMQTLIAPKLQDCVDVEGGYYVQYFLPKKEEKDEKTDKVAKSTEKVSEFLGKIKDTVTGSFSGVPLNGESQTQSQGQETGSVTKDQVKKIGDEIQKFAKGAEKNRIVQARVEVNGLTHGQMRGAELFYFWCGPGCIKSNLYKTSGIEEIKDKNSGKKVKFDYAKGEISVDGKPIVSNPDPVRLTEVDTRVPAYVIPKNLTTVCVEPSPTVGIEINSRGAATVNTPEMLGCIKEGVLAQTGVPMTTSGNLEETFGLVESVITTTHPNIFPNQTEIVAEGVPRKIAQGENAKIFVSHDQEVNLSNSNDKANYVGKLKAIKFKNGIIAAKPDGCFITWLRHHDQAILNQNDVSGIKPKLTTSINPENQCPEPAIDLAAVANPQSSASQAKVDLFNQSMQKLGPFQVFETPTKRYVLYSERNQSGDCQDHLRVIDKETGEIKDFTGKATQTPTGIEFTDEDGNKHKLDFAAENGVPTVSFDGQKPEVLTSAQGRNGAFFYDPKTGLWYADNAQLLPLLEAFREGFGTKLDGNDAVSTATGNQLNVNLGNGSGNLLNLPSLPENKVLLFAFFFALISMIVVARQRVLLKKRKM